MRTFEELGVMPEICEAISELGFEYPMPVQEEVIPYLLGKYGIKDIFDAFSNHLDIPADHTGKLTHVYIDSYQSGEVIDYTGQRYAFRDEPPGVYLEKAPYYFDITQNYLDYIKGVQYIK